MKLTGLQETVKGVVCHEAPHIFFRSLQHCNQNNQKNLQTLETSQKFISFAGMTCNFCEHISCLIKEA